MQARPLRVVLLRLPILAVASLGAGATLARQDNLAIGAVDAVIGYRRTVMADTLKFDACTIFAATGQPADFPAGIGPANLPTLDRRDARPCDVADPPVRLPYRVYVDSLALSDSIGHVYVTVRRGESLHRETFTLRRLRHGGWGVL